MKPSPSADHLQNRNKCQPVIRDGVAYAGRNDLLLPPDQYSILCQLVQMANQHSLGDFRYAPAEFAGAHRAGRETPQYRTLPSAIDNRKHGVDGARRQLLFRNGHLETFLNTPQMALTTL